jgi:hypothetical protein
VHLVGFIMRKFVTMHGHMNVKDQGYLCLPEHFVLLVHPICDVYFLFLKLQMTLNCDAPIADIVKREDNPWAEDTMFVSEIPEI